MALYNDVEAYEAEIDACKRVLIRGPAWKAYRFQKCTSRGVYSREFFGNKVEKSRLRS